MTSIATVASAIPAALATGSGSEVMHPMAISVIGGVTVSTFLTLYVVPCAYSLASRLESKKHETELNEALAILEPQAHHGNGHLPSFPEPTLQ
jgi:HAE1 family hydrophobic/amphiphilic exporter-1